MLRIPSRLDEDLEALIHRVIGCCIEVHRQLGPGLLEVIYQRAVAYELQAKGIQCEREKHYPVTYRGHNLYVHSLDIVVEASWCWNSRRSTGCIRYTEHKRLVRCVRRSSR